MSLTRPSRRSRHLKKMMVVRGTLFLLALVSWLPAQGLRSYVNDEGVRVFTNLGNVPRVAPPMPGPNRYTGLIRRSARARHIDENLIHAIVAVESNYDPLAVSPKGCVGLMQLHPRTARRFGVRNSYDPSQNVAGGVRYLGHLMDLFGGDLPRVLAAYNAGENAVKRYKGIPPYRETRLYVRRVLERYRALGRRPAPPPRRRLERIVEPDGTILFTNLGAGTTVSR